MSTLVNFLFWEAAKTWGHAILGSTIRKAVFQCGGGCGCNELGYQPKKPTRRLRVASGISYDIINIDKKLIARIFFLSYEILLFFPPKSKNLFFPPWQMKFTLTLKTTILTITKMIWNNFTNFREIEKKNSLPVKFIILTYNFNYH